MTPDRLYVSDSEAGAEHWCCDGCGGPTVYGFCIICTPSLVQRPRVLASLGLSTLVHYTGRLHHEPQRRGFGFLARVDAIRAVRGTPESREKTSRINRERVLSPEVKARKSELCRAAALRRWAKVE